MSEHTHDCDCGCNHDQDEEYFITLTLDDGTEMECAVVGFFEADGNDYIALLPTETPEDDMEGEVYLYRYSENEDEQPILDVIESDEEYEIVSEAFDEFLDSIEFDEIIAESEEE